MPGFPFSDLLDALRLKQIPIGVSDYQSVARLVERWNGDRVSDLRTAMAALLATSSDQATVIVETFDALYLTEEPSEPPEEPPRPSWFERVTRGVRAWHVGAVAAFVLVAVIAIRTLIPPTPVIQPPSNATPTNQTAQTPSGELPPPPPSLPSPPVIRDTALLPLITALVGLVVGSGVWAARTRLAQRESSRRAWRQVLASLPGPFYYGTSVISVLSPAMRRAVSDAATILGRRFAESITSDELDVEESLRKTLRAGMRPVLVFKEPPLPAPILILRDVGSEMRVWNRKIDAFIDQLELSGVVVERWYFEEDASFVSRAPHGRVLPLEALAQRHDGAALLIISTGAGVPLALERPSLSWVRVIADWEDRAWLTPINHPLYWRPELRKPGLLPLGVYPMTRLGVVGAARALTGGDITIGVRPPAGVRSVSADDVERMKRLVALVPYPTLELAERLRQRFLPSVPEEVLLFLAEETEGRSSRTIRFSEPEIRRLVAAQRQEAPDQELDVRRFLRNVLEASEPAADSVAHLRWELDRSIQQLHLSMLAPEEESRPMASLEQLADGPLGEEVRRALGVAAAAPDARGRQTIRKLQTRAWSSPPPRLEREAEPERRVDFRWTWPGVTEPVLGVIAAAIAYFALVAWGPFPSHTIEHRRDAYTLEWVAPASSDQPGALIGRRASDSDASIPADVDLYRDGTRVGSMTGLTATSGSVSTVPPNQAAAYYQLRATLPEGNLAVSNPVYVPGAPPVVETPNPIAPVAIVVDLQPWARVRIVGSGAPAGSLETPFTVTLPPGDYTLEAENGNLTGPLTLPLRVVPGQGQVISRAMPGFDVARVVDNLLGRVAAQ